MSNHAVQNFSVSKFPHFSVSSFVFPILFFLVAVPWPTIIEGPLIQSLTRANVAATIELLNFLGVPALQHGNLIEVGTGVVGIDEACSGIRSFQASLMISLFFGELYRLSILRRLSLCFSGFALSFVFNIGRTSLLTWVASQDGVEAIAKWHDPAGVTILVLCFITLWLLSLCLSRRSQSFAPTGREGARRREGVESTESGTGAPPASPSPPRPGRGTEGEVSISSSNVPPAFASPPPCPTSRSAIPQSANRNPHSPGPSILHHLFRLLWLLAAWFLFSEIAVEGWYRWQEHQVPLAAKWSVAWPTDNPSFKPLPFSEKTAQFLRQDEGANGSWSESDGTRWQMIFLRWNPGKIAVHLAKSHTPQACLPATGRKLVSESGPQILRIGQLNLPFRHYVASDAGRIVQVFYCLWEDQTTDQGFAATGLTWWNRVEPVLAGRRNRGQRSLELAIWGIDDPAQAEAAVCAQLEKLLRVEK